MLQFNLTLLGNSVRAGIEDLDNGFVSTVFEMFSDKVYVASIPASWGLSYSIGDNLCFFWN